MKKAIRIFLAFIATALGISCTRVPAPAEVVTITINLAGKTKSVQSDIEALMPSEIGIALHNQATGYDYYGVTGSPITIPAGTYTVTADFNPADYSIFGWAGGNLTTAPAFNVNAAVVVTADATDYYLPASYLAFCVVVDKSQAKQLDASCGGFFATIWNNPASAPEYIFVNRNADDISFSLTMNDDSVVTHHFTTSAEVAAAHPDYTLASHGKYYILGGSSVAPVSPSFSFGLDLPSWEAGD